MNNATTTLTIPTDAAAALAHALSQMRLTLDAPSISALTTSAAENKHLLAVLNNLRADANARRELAERVEMTVDEICSTVKQLARQDWDRTRADLHR